MQLGLQESLDMQTRSLCEEIDDTRKDLHTELNLRIQGTQAEIETMQRGHESRLAEAKA
jgi:hypothetical protein